MIRFKGRRYRGKKRRSSLSYDRTPRKAVIAIGVVVVVEGPGYGES
jgi:hypothetical protein